MSTTWNARGTAALFEGANDDSRVTTTEPAAIARLRLLSTAEVAEWVGRSERTVRGWARDGLLRKRRVGRGIYYSEVDVLAALNIELDP